MCAGIFSFSPNKWNPFCFCSLVHLLWPLSLWMFLQAFTQVPGDHTICTYRGKAFDVPIKQLLNQTPKQRGLSLFFSNQPKHPCQTSDPGQTSHPIMMLSLLPWSIKNNSMSRGTQLTCFNRIRALGTDAQSHGGGIGLRDWSRYEFTPNLLWTASVEHNAHGSRWPTPNLPSEKCLSSLTGNLVFDNQRNGCKASDISIHNAASDKESWRLRS